MSHKKYKKVLAAGLAAVMTMGMLTGCGGGGSSSNTALEQMAAISQRPLAARTARHQRTREAVRLFRSNG